MEDEAKIMHKLTVSKKKESFKVIKEWAKHRQQTLGLHRMMIDILLAEVDVRLKSSVENFGIYSQFFRERAKQE